MSTKFLFITSVMFPFLLLGGCGEEKVEPVAKAPIFEIDSAYLEVDINQVGGVRKIPIKTNLDWDKLSFSSNQEWCKVSKDDIEKDHIKLTFEKSEETNIRTAEVSVKSSVKNYTIIAKQLGATPHISITTTTSEFGQSGGKTEVRVTSNVKYTISKSENSDWINEITPDKVEESVTYWEVDANLLNGSRKATLYYKERDGQAKDSCLIIQRGTESVEVINLNINTTKESGTESVLLVANMDWDKLAISSDQIWCTAVKDDVEKNHIRLTFQESEMSNERIAKITINSSVQPYTITVTQLGSRPQILVVSNTTEFGAGGGETQINVTSNIDYVVSKSENSDWLTDITPAGGAKSVYLWKVSANPLFEDRTATLLYTDNNGSIEVSCTINQKKSEFVKIPVTEITITPAALSLIVTNTSTLVATVTPENATDKTVTWVSSNEAVASVSADGVVNAKSIGVATITATADTQTVTCEVTVLEDPNASEGGNEDLTEGEGIF